MSTFYNFLYFNVLWAVSHHVFFFIYEKKVSSRTQRMPEGYRYRPVGENVTSIC